MMVYNLQGILFWTSLYEIALWVFMLFVFFAAPSKLAVVWVHIGHVPRGVLGFMVLSKIPKSDHLIEGIEFKGL